MRHRFPSRYLSVVSLFLFVWLNASRSECAFASQEQAPHHAGKRVLGTPTESSRERLTVVLFDQAVVHGETLGRVRYLVSRIYDDAGIDITWTNRPSWNRREHVDNTSFTVQIVIRPTCPPPAPGSTFELGRYRASRPGAALIVGTTPGVSHRMGGTAFVYLEPILNVMHERADRLTSLLAYTMAHEMGHILLPYPAHTESGIMRPAWDRRDLVSIARGDVRFTPEQAAAMRAKIAAKEP